MYLKKLSKITRDDKYNFDKSQFLRLDANERVIPFSKKDLKFIRSLIDNYTLQSYPTNRREVLNIISKKENISSSKISITPGADTVLKYIFELISNNKGEVLSIYPTYGMIDVYCNIYGKKHYKINEQQLYKFSNIKNYKNISLVYVANPNSPSGKIIPKKIILDIVNITKKKNILFVIDEAYIHYSNSKSLKDLVSNNNNILVIRTFSKYFGLAGVRIGTLISNKFLLKIFNALRPPHDISNLSIQILKYFFLKKKDDYLNKIKQSKIFIKKFCEEKKIEIFITEANFFHIFQEKKKIKLIVNELKKRKILVKSNYINFSNVSYNGPKNTIRVSIGSIAQMKFFFKNYISIIS